MSRAGLLTIGQTMASLNPVAAVPLSRGASFKLSMAGAESNVAIAVRRLGFPATWIGQLGDDAAGAMIRRELLAEGVRVNAAVDPTRPTGLILFERRTADQTRAWYYRKQAAGVGLTPDDVDPELVSGAGMVHLTGITPLLGDGPARAVAGIIERARAAQVSLSVDLNYRAALASPSDFAATVTPMLAAADIVFATMVEAALFTSAQDLVEITRALHTLGPRTVVLKFGAEGSLASSAGAVVRQEPISVQAVDTVGAGDAFAGGFLAAVLAQQDLKEQLSQAARVAAVAVSTHGDWEGLPTGDELATILNAGDIVR
jgi:2-dehydro-3-deoxygluconokinase